jgi:hypothetical protein
MDISPNSDQTGKFLLNVDLCNFGFQIADFGLWSSTANLDRENPKPKTQNRDVFLVNYFKAGSLESILDRYSKLSRVAINHLTLTPNFPGLQF